MYTTYNPYLYESATMMDNFSSLISLAIQIFTIVAMCKVYAKLGLEWWAAIIPVYNIYVLAKKVWDDKNAKITLWLDLGTLILAISYVAVLAGTGTAGAGYGSMSTLSIMFLLSIVLLAVSIALLVWEIRIYSRVSKKFGHGDGFTVGLILLRVIFFGILAFSKDEEVVETEAEEKKPIEEE